MSKKNLPRARHCEACGVVKRFNNGVFLSRFPLDIERLVICGFPVTRNISKLKKTPSEPIQKQDHKNDKDATESFDIPFLCDDINFDEILPPMDHLKTTEEDREINKPFTWQNQGEVVSVAAEEAETAVAIPDDNGNLLMYCDDEATASITEKDEHESEHEGYKCNSCTNDIVGYRYTCVQCKDYDLCSACEASGVHPHHYVLRVPGPRSQEVQGVLERTRNSLNMYISALAECCDIDHISIKSEPKEEPHDLVIDSEERGDILEQYSDHPEMKEAVSDHDDDPLSTHYKEVEYLEDDILIPLSPCDKESSTIKNLDTNYEVIEVPDRHAVNRPRCVESKLKRKITINKSKLRRVKKIASFIPNNKIRLTVKRTPINLPSKSKDDSTNPEIIVQDSNVLKLQKYIDFEKNLPLRTDESVVHRGVTCSASQVVSSNRKTKYVSVIGRKTENASETEKQVRLLAIKSKSDFLAPQTNTDFNITYYVPEKMVASTSEESNLEKTKSDSFRDRENRSLSQINLIKSIMSNKVSVRVQPLSEEQIISLAKGGNGVS